MGGGVVTSTARVRIKGRKLSVMRFLIMSIAYTIPWIIMLSQLAYYSKIYGPQVLLQLNIAYYLPSIPILLLLGHVEKLLDEQFGTTASMAIRITIGLMGCAAISASYPFIPTRLSYLLGLVVGLGSISAVAFSTSYQLVAWFRSADTIALGIGCVASGPLALVIQIALHLGTAPKRWQWIALFEIAAGLVLVGLLAAWSLFLQYWHILCGKEAYLDTSVPLLDTAEQAQAEHVEQEAGEQALMLSRMLTMQDPFQGFPFTTMPGMALPHLRPLLRRALSDDMSDIRRQSHRSHVVHALNRPGVSGRSRTAGAALMARKLGATAAATTAAATAPPAAGASKLSGPPAGDHKNALQQQRGGGGSWQQLQQAAAAAAAPNGNAGGGGGSPAAAAAAWFDAEQQLGLGGTTAGAGSWVTAARTASVASSSVHSSRPASPCPIPAPAHVRMGSYLEDEPDFVDFLQQQVQRLGLPLGTSAPTTTSAGIVSMLGDKEQDMDGTALANVLVAAAAKAAGNAAPGDSEASDNDASGVEAQHPESSPHSSRSSRRNQSRAATAAAEALARGMPDPALAAAVPAAGSTEPAGAGQLGVEHSLQGWIIPAERSLSAAAAGSKEGSSAVDSSPAVTLTPQAAAAGSKPGSGAATLGSAHVLDILPPSGLKTSSSQQSLKQHEQASGAISAKRSLQASFQQQQQQQQPPGQQQEGKAAQQQHKYRHVRTASDTSIASNVSAFSAAAGSEAAGGASDGMSVREEPPEPEGLGAVYWEVFKYCWMVVLAALVSSTLLNCIFPFFTYVESSGMLGEFLPQVLFYTRMLSDIAGRMVPRKKVLAITAPAALLALSGALLLCSVAFFVYLQVPPHMQSDPYVLVLVLLLWLGGGYINTMGYILAPCLVPPRLCTKASALMVIAYKASHLLGLSMAIGLALWLYGDISGAL